MISTRACTFACQTKYFPRFTDRQSTPLFVQQPLIISLALLIHPSAVWFIVPSESRRMVESTREWIVIERLSFAKESCRKCGTINWYKNQFLRDVSGSYVAFTSGLRFNKTHQCKKQISHDLLLSKLIGKEDVFDLCAHRHAARCILIRVSHEKSWSRWGRNVNVDWIFFFFTSLRNHESRQGHTRSVSRVYLFNRKMRNHFCCESV